MAQSVERGGRGNSCWMGEEERKKKEREREKEGNRVKGLDSV